MALRWGIAAAGKISSDFVNALQIYPESDHQVVAVAARKLQSAQEFAEKFGIPKAYEGYKGCLFVFRSCGKFDGLICVIK